MKNSTFSERLLIVAALVICAIIIGYNAFYSPQATTPVVYKVSSEVSAQEEEYQPLPGKGQLLRLNLNTASAEELARHIPGVGDHLAQDIVEYRELHHGFQNMEELKEIDGIGEKTFEKMKPYLTLTE